jgi:hypothetical protein
MSGTENSNPFHQCGLLFGDPKDGTLSNATKKECLALFTQNEINGRGLTRTTDDPPGKQMFLDHASMINGLPHASDKRKAEMQSLLCMDYLSSKNGSLVTSVPNMTNLSVHTFYDSQKLPSVDNTVATPSDTVPAGLSHELRGL